MGASKGLVIGAGFAGMAAAAFLARQGREVVVLEKLDMPGGKARVWAEQGFVFDMGPSWYLMPEVFDNFFAQFGQNREDYYRLKRLDPYYRVFFSDQEIVDIKNNPTHNKEVFNSFESGSGAKLEEYLEAAAYKYDVAMREFMYRDYRSVFQFLNRRMMTEGIKLDMFSPLDNYVQKYFQDRRARQILEYAMVFLGNSPYNAPALYSIMSHVDFNLGVWYPEGGMGRVADAFYRLARKEGVKFSFKHEVKALKTEGSRVTGVVTEHGDFEADLVLATADYAHVETELLPPAKQTYSQKYWDGKVLAPSMLLAYLGVNKKIDTLAHHNLYLAKDWAVHFEQIFDRPTWPHDPCYYVGCPSRTDSTVAPPGKENIFFLIPIAIGLEDTPEIREKVFNRSIEHFEKLTGESIREHLQVKRLFSLQDFAQDYHAYNGTALGLAHTLKQTAVYRPGHRSKKLKNLYYAGQYNHPGVGVPMVLISAQIAAQIIKDEQA